MGRRTKKLTKRTDLRQNVVDLAWYGDDFMDVVEQSTPDGLFRGGEVILEAAQCRPPSTDRRPPAGRTAEGDGQGVWNLGRRAGNRENVHSGRTGQVSLPNSWPRVDLDWSANREGGGARHRSDDW